MSGKPFEKFEKHNPADLPEGLKVGFLCLISKWDILQFLKYAIIKQLSGGKGLCQ